MNVSWIHVFSRLFPGLSVFILTAAWPALAAEIIAHRGASFDAPENTLASMKLAWEQQADAVELDLYLSKDGKIAVFHDADTRRFEKQARRIGDLTWAEMQQLDVGAWKGQAFAGERIPALEPILKTIPPGKRAVLEIKCDARILPELERVLKASGRANRELVIIAFSFDTLQRSKQRFPGIAHYFLVGWKKGEQAKNPDLAETIAQAKAGGFDGLDLQSDWPITAGMVRQIKQAGLKWLTWTVDDPVVAQKLVAAGVDGITTNRPQWLRERLKATP
jgi:glycerophosphoryl diester phosphodiesterase